MLEGAGPRFSRAGKDFFREREKAVSGTEWDDLHKAGWADSHDSWPLGRISRLPGHRGFFPWPEKGHGDEINPVSIEENFQFPPEKGRIRVLEQLQ